MISHLSNQFKINI